MNLLHDAHSDRHHRNDGIRFKLAIVEIERQVDIDDHIPIAVEAKLYKAILGVPFIDLREQLSTVPVFLEIGDVINFDLDESVRVVILAHGDDDGHGLVISLSSFSS